MSNLFITPILFYYDFLDELCVTCAKIKGIDINNTQKYKEFKISIFLNFNRYLVDSFLFLPQNGELLEKLNLLIEKGDENGTMELLNSEGNILKIKDEFIEIIKNSKK